MGDLPPAARQRRARAGRSTGGRGSGDGRAAGVASAPGGSSARACGCSCGRCAQLSSLVVWCVMGEREAAGVGRP